MGRLIYSMIQSLDGYTEDAQGDFSWGAPDEALHTFVNELASSVGTYLYGRRMYETMVYWETAHTLPDQPQHELDWARQWQAAEKVVYSRTLAEPRSARTRIERAFDPEAVRQLKAGAAHDFTVARVYKMSLESGVWKLWRDVADFSPLDFAQRYTGTFSADGQRIVGAWEICHDGTTWEHDFDLAYIRDQA